VYRRRRDAVHARLLGDSIQAGFTRRYQVIYRDGNAAFCTQPAEFVQRVERGPVVWAP
jgi:hypothetical protein